MKFPALARVLERLAVFLRYGLRRKCPLCGNYDSHHPLCVAPRTKAEWEAAARQYYNAWRRDEMRTRDHLYRARERAALWQGKFHTLRLENNALRRKVTRAPHGAPEPYTAPDGQKLMICPDCEHLHRPKKP